MADFYDGTKLLSLLDSEGRKPEIYIVTSNRTGGKTTFFNRMVFRKAIMKGEKFMLIYRFKDELDDCADKFFKDINGLFFPQYSVFSKKRAKGAYHELFYRHVSSEEPVSCGYAIALNSADAIKKLSHFFSDTTCMLFDEFQSETNHYCPDEVSKFISVHTSVARGQGKQTRYVPVYMLSNPVTILNPYYVNMDISTRLNKNVKFLRGNGFVLEQGYNESAANAMKESGFMQAFNRSIYCDYAMEGTYLSDNNAFIEQVNGRSRYLATIKYKNAEYAIRQFEDYGIIYCDNKADKTFPTRLAVTTDDHNVNYVMLKTNEFFISSMRYFFEKGCFRFKDLKCKDAVLKLLSY